MTVEVRQLADGEIAEVDARLPLHRLAQGDGFYVVAWADGAPVAHAYLAVTDPPELQDVYVLPEYRRRGIATELTGAAEREAAARGARRLLLSYGHENEAARRLYERAGYVDAGLPPKHVRGTITIRGEPVEVDDVLVYLVKQL